MSATLDSMFRLSERDADGGLHRYQAQIVAHALTHLEHRPGLIIAERTGRGKSQIAMAIMAAMAMRVTDRPLRVGLLAPSDQVLGNWTGTEDGLLVRAFTRPQDKTYLWRESGLDLRVVRQG